MSDIFREVEEDVRRERFEKLWKAYGNYAIAALVTKRSDIHYPKPKVVSVTQATELGSVYSPAEIAALTVMAHKAGMKCHMDGARFANALVATGASPAEMTWKAGVDLLCFGGTKNGMAVGEAVIFFDRARAGEFAFRRKRAGHTLSKGRFLGAQAIAYLDGGHWLAVLLVMGAVIGAFGV